MKSFQTKRVILFVLAIVFNFVASAAPVVGKVADAGTGEAIIGATIYDSRSHVGVITDAEGNFRIDVATFPSELKISYVGYEQKTIRVKGDDKDLVVALKEEDHNLNEIVVVGYGTQKRTQLTGSVTKVKADIFETSQSATLDGALSGQVAGLNVTASSGQPGADSHIRIRGGKHRQMVKLLCWDGDGFLLYQKRLEKGTFELPRFRPDLKAAEMPYRTLSAIMRGVSLKSVRYRSRLRIGNSSILQPPDYQ